MRSNFKKTMRLLGSLVLLILMVQCSYFFEEKETTETAQPKVAAGECFTEANQFVKEYFKGDANQKLDSSRYDHFANCYQGLITDLVTYTVSGREESEAYSAENLEVLVSTFYTNSGFNVSRISGYIHLKHFIMGGEPDGVSKEEFLFLKDIVPELTRLLKELEPHRSILLRKADLERSKVDYKRFKIAQTLLLTKAKMFFAKFDKFDGDRSTELKPMMSFVLTELLGKERAEEYSKFFDLYIEFKNLVLNQESDELHRNDAGTLLEQSLNGNSALHQFSAFIEQKEGDGDDFIFDNLGTVASFVSKVAAQLKDSSIFKTVALESAFDVIDLSKNALLESISRSEHKDLQFIKVRNFIQELEDSGIMKGKLRAETLSDFLQDFAEGWVAPGRRTTRPPVAVIAGEETPTFVTASMIGYLENLIFKWMRRQQFVNTLFADESIQDVSQKSLFKALGSSRLSRDWREILQKVDTQDWGTDRRLRLGGVDLNYTYEELTVSNSLGLLIEAFMRPFNKSTTPLTKLKVTKDQSQKVYELLRHLGVALEFMDARITNSGERTFREGNNFMTLRTSNEFLDIFEAYEYLSIATSSGNVSEYIYQNIDEAFRKRGWIDSIGREVIHADRFRRSLRKNFGEIFSNLEAVSNYWSGASYRERDEFFEIWEITSRAGIISEKPVDMNEIRVFVTILYYLESIFHNFDVNRDGMINGYELDTAEKHFRRLVKGYIVDNKPESVSLVKGYAVTSLKKANPSDEEILEWLAPKVFIYLLETGDIPTGGIRFDSLLRTKSHAGDFAAINGDVKVVLNVFAGLAKITRNSHIAQIQRFLKSNIGFDTSTLKHGIMQELKADEPPSCRGSVEFEEKPIFCQWARTLYCNESVNGLLFDEMQRKRDYYFPRHLWASSYGEGSSETMKRFSEIFFSEKIFSTQCAFPVLTGETELEYEPIPEDGPEVPKPSLFQKGMELIHKWNN